MRKRILLLCGLLLLSSLTGCKSTENTVNVKQGEYVAGGTIPVAAKVYPIVDDELPMTKDDENNILDADDIWTLTHYVDLWVTGNDTRGDGFNADEVSKFADSESVKSVSEVSKSGAYEFEVKGVQILTIKALSKNEVEILYLVRASGHNSTVAEGEYDMVDTLKFKRVNKEWHLSGINELCYAPKDTIDFEQDPITGNYTIAPTAEYWT